MMLTPREMEKLLIYVLADLARKRRAKGLKLNYAEAVAVISETLLEGAREGKTVAELMTLGRHVLTEEDVMENVPQMLHLVQVEATFPDGTKLISCHDPLGPAGIPPYILREEPVEINAGRRRTRLTVQNTGDRPVQVGSHYHFFEVNRALEFDRAAARGMRLDIPAGTAVRFEPGIEMEVDLVEMGGAQQTGGVTHGQD